MLSALLILIGCQLIGELARQALALPIPGPVIGMFLLAILLVLDGRAAKLCGATLRASLGLTAETLISHMGLLFVPAGVGLLAETDLIRREWLPIFAALVISTIVSLAVTGLVMRLVSHFSRKRSRRLQADLIKSGKTP